MPTYGSITARLVSDSSIRFYTAPYVIPNNPATMANYPFNYFPSATDQPVVASAMKYDAGALYDLNGLQLRLVTPSSYSTANFGGAVDSSNAASFTTPAGASVWGGKYGLSTLRWNGGDVFAACGAATFPSTTGVAALSSTADVLGFPDDTVEIFGPQAVRWEGVDYMLMFSLPLSASEPRVLLGDIDGNLSWAAIWSGGDPAAGAHAAMWYPDQGGGFNHAFQGGVFSSVRPSIVTVPSAGLGAETYNHITLDDPTFDAAFWAAASVSAPEQPYGQVRPEGWLFNTDSGYFIILSPDGAEYSVVRPVPGDATAATVINEELFSGFATFARGEDGAAYLMNPSVPWSGAPDLAVLTSSSPTAAPTPPVPEPFSLGRWRGQSGINWLGFALVGDAFTNLVGRSDFNIFTEYGNRLEFVVTTPPVQENRKRIFVNLAEIQMEAGQGEPDDPSAAPVIMFDYSKDGGKTWVQLQQFRSMGSAGQYLKRMRWVNVGQAREWVFRFRYTGGARPAIIGTYLSVRKGLG